MKKFITTALVCLSVVAVAAAPSLAAGSAPAKKTTGDLWFTNDYGPDYGGKVSAHWVFNAIEGTPAKGSVYYEDSLHGSYTAKVTSVTVDSANHDATFTAEVTVDNYDYAELGTTFKWTVHDRAGVNGEQGVGNDYFTYWALGTTPIDLPAITTGNLQVLG